MLVCRAELIGIDRLRQGGPRAALRQAYRRHGMGSTRVARRDGRHLTTCTSIGSARSTCRIGAPDRVALVGDAAACPSLLAGEGTGLGMLEAYVLAGELHRADGDCAARVGGVREPAADVRFSQTEGRAMVPWVFRTANGPGAHVAQRCCPCVLRSRCSRSRSGRARCTTISRCLITRWVEEGTLQEMKNHAAQIFGDI